MCYAVMRVPTLQHRRRWECRWAKRGWFAGRGDGQVDRGGAGIEFSFLPRVSTAVASCIYQFPSTIIQAVKFRSLEVEHIVQVLLLLVGNFVGNESLRSWFTVAFSQPDQPAGTGGEPVVASPASHL
jgi:hypothetical protein